MKYLFILSVLLAGCANDIGKEQTVGAAPSSDKAERPTGRFVVTYQGGFQAGSLDHASTRAVYIVKDTKTGQEWVGVEGIGISSLQTEGSGDSAKEVER